MAEHDTVRHVDAVVVGAGFSGLYMPPPPAPARLEAQVVDAAADVGGTWWWNRYPGARCDIESMDYSYSFDPELEQEWTWSERYATQPEILAYANHVADRFDLRRDIRFETRVTRAEWDHDASRWSVDTDRGDRWSARYLVMAVGCLSAANAARDRGHRHLRRADLTTPASGPTRVSTSPACGWASSARARRASSRSR